MSAPAQVCPGSAHLILSLSCCDNMLDWGASQHTCLQMGDLLLSCGSEYQD